MTMRTRLAALRQMLYELEAETELKALSAVQRDVYYAACLLLDDGGEIVNSEHLREHPLLKDMPRSSFFRVLRELAETGYIQTAGTPRSGLYRIQK